MERLANGRFPVSWLFVWLRDQASVVLLECEDRIEITPIHRLTEHRHNGFRCVRSFSLHCHTILLTHAAITPPSTAKMLPVVQRDSSEAK